MLLHGCQARSSASVASGSLIARPKSLVICGKLRLRAACPRTRACLTRPLNAAPKLCGHKTR